MGASALYKVSGPFAAGTALASNDGLGSQVVTVSLATGALRPFVRNPVTTKGLVYVDPSGSEAPSALAPLAAATHTDPTATVKSGGSDDDNLDAPAAIRFLGEAFGFEEVASRKGVDEDSIDHAELRWPGGGGVMLGSARQDSSIAELPPGTGSIYVVTEDADGFYERARRAGATIAQELRDEDYGSRGFTARDPEGVFWSFGTYAGA